AGFLHGLLNGVEHRTVQVLLSAAAGNHAAHDIGAVGDGLLGGERGFFAGGSLHDQSSIAIYQYAHPIVPNDCAASLTTFWAASSMSCPTVKLSPESPRTGLPRP